MQKNISWLLDVPLAHRGLHNIQNNIPENSLAAFKNAIEANIPIELDVHLIENYELIVFHDYDLVRISDKNKKIEELKKSELKHYKILNTDQTIPLLSEVLQLVNGSVPILIEIKNHENVGYLERIITMQLENYNGNFAVQSFDPAIVNWFRKNAPQIIRGQLSRTYDGEGLPFYRKFFLKHLFWNFITRPHFIGVQAEMLSYYSLRFWKKTGLHTLSWTIRSKEEEEMTKGLAENIIFEGYSPDGLELNKWLSG